MAPYHVNFHTLDGRPIFEDESYDQAVRVYVRDAIRRHKILCPAHEVMPTHVHMIIEDFPDLLRGSIIHLVKGSAAHVFFDAFPELRADLLGGHLWTKGYHYVEITSHRQFLATLQYVRTNREHADLPPPVPLKPANER